MSEHPRRIVVVTIDRWNVSTLGPYGATWVETPGCDELAARGTLFAQAWTDSLDLSSVSRSWFNGQHAAAKPIVASGAESLPHTLAAGGWAARIWSDDPQWAETAEFAGFGDAVALVDRLATGAENLPSDADEDEILEATRIGRAMSEALRWSDDAPERSVSWIHLRGMADAWDAPYAWREQFCDEDDPRPPRETDPPSRAADVPLDPDERLGWVRAYAAQCQALDLAIGKLLLPRVDDERLWIIASPRGISLGDHDALGSAGDRLSEETMHVPCFVVGSSVERLVRRQSLVQPADIPATILHAAGQSGPSWRWGQSLIAGRETRPRDRAVANGPNERAMLTRAWLLRQSRAMNADPWRDELFVKPDDVCDANEVSSRRESVVAELAAKLDEFARAESPERLTPLHEEATSPWR